MVAHKKPAKPAKMEWVLIMWTDGEKVALYHVPTDKLEAHLPVDRVKECHGHLINVGDVEDTVGDSIEYLAYLLGEEHYHGEGELPAFPEFCKMTEDDREKHRETMTDEAFPKPNADAPLHQYKVEAGYIVMYL